MSDRARLRSLYVCYLSLEDPLVHTQVVAYLSGLARAGHRIHLLTFEAGRLTPGRRRRWRRSLSAEGIAWHGLRYHKRPSLPATVYDTLAGAVYASLLIRRHRLDALHARAHVPAAIGLLARRLAWPRRPALIFDIRGLMAEEYADAGRWTPSGVPFRLTKAVERAAIRRAAAIVVLTERVRRLLFDDQLMPPVTVIPCCADIDALEMAPGARDRMRATLGLQVAPVMVYLGKFGGWYLEREMAECFAVARLQLPGLHFLVLTQADPDVLRVELQRLGVGAGEYTITSAPPNRVGAYLSACDFAISFIEPAPSKVASSPTKIGEYLAAGLPILSTAGVGDLDRLLTPDVAALLHAHTPSAYGEALSQIVRLLADPETARRCHSLADRELSLERVGIPRYDELYQRVAALTRPAGRTEVGRSAARS
jgi:glycosyltransferase involved in cell wall biosynthesis